MADKQATTQRDGFKSKWGFILACIGSAVGMGNIWRFPIMVSVWGGMTFLIPYFICVLLIGSTGVIGEFALGRATGAGPIGMSALVISKFRGARVIMADTNPYRLEQAERFGADFVFNPAKEDVKKAVRTLTGRHGVDVSLDCSGAESAQIQCLEVLGGGGRMAFLGIRSTATTINPWKHLMSKEITVIGSWAATPQDHLDLVSMLQCGMPAQQIITHRFDLEDADEAFRTFFSGQAVKVATQVL